MTVRVNDVVGVARFALPGNYVDVMVNVQQDKTRGEDNLQISKTLLSHMLLLAVAQKACRDDTKSSVLSATTLELSLEDSEKIDLARSVGTLHLVFCNQVDQQTVVTQGITKYQLLGERTAVVEPAASGKPAQRGRYVRSAIVMRRGLSKRFRGVEVFLKEEFQLNKLTKPFKHLVWVAHCGIQTIRR